MRQLLKSSVLPIITPSKKSSTPSRMTILSKTSSTTPVMELSFGGHGKTNNAHNLPYEKNQIKTSKIITSKKRHKLNFYKTI